MALCFFRIKRLFFPISHTCRTGSFGYFVVVRRSMNFCMNRKPENVSQKSLRLKQSEKQELSLDVGGDGLAQAMNEKLLERSRRCKTMLALVFRMAATVCQRGMEGDRSPA